MKAKTFENLIRKIVREEIDYALRREIKSLKEDLRDEIKPVIVEESPISTQNSLKEKIMGTKPIIKKQAKKHNFVGDNTLNDLLNETARGDTNTQTAMSPVSIEENFSTIGDMPAEAVPDSVVNAVTRDYSDLMKAIDKKKNK